MSEVSAVQQVVDVFDSSPTKTAAAIGGGVLRQHVEHWLKSGRMPAEHCPVASNLTGVPLWALRPDDWHRIWPMLIGTAGAPEVIETAEVKAS